MNSPVKVFSLISVFAALVGLAPAASVADQYISRAECAEIVGEVIVAMDDTNPSCTDGVECTEFGLNCIYQGRQPLCLNAGITVCVPIQAASRLLDNEKAVRGNCCDSDADCITRDGIQYSCIQGSCQLSAEGSSQ